MTGQGSKIFTIGETLREAGIGGESVRRYQELAVVQGLAKYAQVLQGQERDLLLLDLTHRGIGIRASLIPGGETPAPLTHPRRKQPGDDSEVEVLLERLATIPTRRSALITFAGGRDEPVRLPVVERSKTADENVDITVLEFTAPGEEVELEVTVDVDANSIIVLSVHDLTNRAVFLAQLNQRYRTAYELLPNSILRLILGGWTVYDRPESGAPEGQPGDVYRYPAQGRSLATLTAEAEVSRLREEIAQRRRWTSDATRTTVQQREAEVGAADRAQLLGRLLAAVNRPHEALDSLTDALAAFVRRRRWYDALPACEQACDIMKTLDETERGPRLRTIAEPLRAAIPDVELGSAADMRARENALERFAALLSGAGAEREARDLLAARDRQEEIRRRSLALRTDPSSRPRG